MLVTHRKNQPTTRCLPSTALQALLRRFGTFSARRIPPQRPTDTGTPSVALRQRSTPRRIMSERGVTLQHLATYRERAHACSQEAAGSAQVPESARAPVPRKSRSLDAQNSGAEYRHRRLQRRARSDGSGASRESRMPRRLGAPDVHPRAPEHRRPGAPIPPGE